MDCFTFARSIQKGQKVSYRSSGSLVVSLSGRLRGVALAGLLDELAGISWGRVAGGLWGRQQVVLKIYINKKKRNVPFYFHPVIQNFGRLRHIPECINIKFKSV
jgi:hypothetical protein